MKYLLILLAVTLSLSSIKAYSQNPGSNKFKQEFLRQINLTRQKGCKCGTTYMPPASPLIWNDQLEKAAKKHADDMSSKRYFSHISKNGLTALNRAEKAGYDHNGYRSFMVGENIAQGQPTITEVMNGWFGSEGHCMNLMNPTFKEVGVWVSNTYWVQDFGGREEFSDEMKKMIKSGKARIVPGTSSREH